MSLSDNDNRPTVGFVNHRWNAEKVACSRCGKRVWQGIVAVNQRINPPRRCLCHRCYRAVMLMSPEQGQKEEFEQDVERGRAELEALG
jgi:hypothetical protein